MRTFKKRLYTNGNQIFGFWKAGAKDYRPFPSKDDALQWLDENNIVHYPNENDNMVKLSRIQIESDEFWASMY